MTTITTPATDRQVAYLQDLGATESQIAGLDIDTAFTLIDSLAARRTRREVSPDDDLYVVRMQPRAASSALKARAGAYIESIGGRYVRLASPGWRIPIEAVEGDESVVVELARLYAVITTTTKRRG